MAELRALARPADRTILFQRSVADYDQTGAVDILTMFNRFLIDVVSRYRSRTSSSTGFMICSVTSSVIVSRRRSRAAEGVGSAGGGTISSNRPG